MLLEASNINPHAELVGQDIDARCVKITAINLGLRSRYGWVVCGNTLTGDTQFAYRVGSVFKPLSGAYDGIHSALSRSRKTMLEGLPTGV
jgi:hypothetical protein